MKLLVDGLLVTVNPIEARAVLTAFAEKTGEQAHLVSIGDCTYHDLGELNGQRLAMVQSEMGSIGVGASLQTVQEAISTVQPAAVVMVGVAFGTKPDKQKMGDVLVSNRIAVYEPERLGMQKGRTVRLPRGSKVDASHKLLSFLRACEVQWQRTSIDVQFGLILSGEKLIDNVEFRNLLLENEPEAIGGEMEGAGLYAACHKAKCDWILVKAICDWADGNKGVNKRDNQLVASGNAAQFVSHAFHSGDIVARDKAAIVAAKRTAGSEPGRDAVTMTIDKKQFGSLSLDEQFRLVTILARIAAVPPDDIKIVASEKGSIVLTIDTTHDAAKRILQSHLANSSELASLDIQSISLLQKRKKVSSFCELKATIRNFLIPIPAFVRGLVRRDDLESLYYRRFAQHLVLLASGFVPSMIVAGIALFAGADIKKIVEFFLITKATITVDLSLSMLRRGLKTNSFIAQLIERAMYHSDRKDFWDAYIDSKSHIGRYAIDLVTSGISFVLAGLLMSKQILGNASDTEIRAVSWLSGVSILSSVRFLWAQAKLRTDDEILMESVMDQFVARRKA